MNRIVLCSLVAALLGGCFGAAPPVPRDHYYRILVPPPKAEAVGEDLLGVVSIPPFEASGLLRERPLLFSAGEQSLEIQQHDYHYWTDPPPQMLQAQLASYLRQVGLADTVVTPAMRIRPDFEVAGRIKRLERLLDGHSARVAAELDLALIDLTGRRLTVMKTYAVERNCPDDSINGAIIALNQAVTQIFDQFLADARRTTLAGRPPGALTGSR